MKCVAEYKKRIDMRLRIYNGTISTNDEPQQQPAKLYICDAGENEKDAIRLTVGGGILEVGDLDENIAGEIERWLQDAEATTPSTWNNTPGDQPLSEALIDDIEAHIRPLQRRMRRSFKRLIEGTSYR
ncbi:unnamed protein product [Ceratitis capitata]|uniref:(Mediterranean fruit fly) hypothetical protein n=1 Tax=Ceratitis capitata TaxID=7213 RepID=A0A811UPY3_CERCA|nr:unnamed protein product [Ceratitis capitata]